MSSDLEELQARWDALNDIPPKLPPHIRRSVDTFKKKQRANQAAEKKDAESKVTLRLREVARKDEYLSNKEKQVIDTEKAIIKLSEIISNTTQKSEQMKIYNLYLNPKHIQDIENIQSKLTSEKEKTENPVLENRIQEILRKLNALKAPLIAWKTFMEEKYPELKKMVRAPVVSKQGGRKRKRKTRKRKTKGGNQASKCSQNQITISYEDIENGKLLIGDKVYVKGIGDIGLWMVTNIVHANANDPKWGVEITKGKEVIFLGSGDLIHERKRICKSKPIGWKRGGRKTKRKKNKRHTRKTFKHRKPKKKHYRTRRRR